MNTGPAILWHDWSTEAFAKAHRGATPVLLLVTASWSGACRTLERDTFARPEVQAALIERFVPVRVDADRRPDIADRYGLGAWPTLACLTADGEVLAGGIEIDAERLTRWLGEVSVAYATRRAEIDRRARDARRSRRGAVDVREIPAAVPGEARAVVADAVRSAFDETWAGFGEGAKTPLVAPIAFALVEGRRTGDSGLLDIGIRTLDRIGWSDLSDPDGAFHRATRRRDWTDPDTARLLGVQADLAMLFLDAAVVLGEAAYADRARAALSYVRATLAAPDGGFFNSESDGEASGREIDRMLVTAANARIARALLHASDVLEDPSHGEIALATIERIVPAVYAPGAGVAHCLVDGVPRVRGLLAGQVDLSAALVDLSRASGNRVYLELADELMRSCARKLWHEGRQAFLDRLPTMSGAGDVGRLGDPLVPFAANCAAARVLADIARETGHAELRETAVRTVASLGRVYRDYGILGADFVLSGDAVAPASDRPEGVGANE